MENRILPDADERCTYTSTCIRYGHDRAVVKFFNSREMDGVLRGYLEKLGVENVDSYTYQSLSRSEYMSVFSKLDERDKSMYENTVHARHFWKREKGFRKMWRLQDLTDLTIPDFISQRSLRWRSR